MLDGSGSSIPQPKTLNQLRNTLAQKTRLSEVLKSASTDEEHAPRLQLQDSLA